VKNILKKIFPLLFLRKVQLIFNQLLLKIYYPLIFPKFQIQDTDYLEIHTGNPFLQLFKGKSFSKKEKIDFELWLGQGWSQDHYIIRISLPHQIESFNGWAYTYGRCLIYPSLGLASAPYLKRPSLWDSVVKNPSVNFDHVVSFRDTGEENYFHFFNDVISKFYWLESKALLNSEQIFLISDKLYNRDYFQYFINNTRLGNYNWKVQAEKELIGSSDTLFCKTATHDSFLYDQMLKDICVPKENLKQNKRIYLTRKDTSLRFISNEQELLPVLKEYGFQVIDPSEMSFEEQVDLFSQVSCLISPHGAGLTNMMFRKGGSMKIVELFSPYQGYNPFHYIMMAEMFGFGYTYIIGTSSALKYKGGFKVSKIELLDILKALDV
jgi:Glycosyltransferase 61